MGMIADPQSSYSFDFAFTTSGDQTVTHNLGLPQVNGSYANAAETVITDGDAYVHTVGANSFHVYCTSSTVAGHFRPKVRVGDYPTS